MGGSVFFAEGKGIVFVISAYRGRIWHRIIRTKDRIRWVLISFSS